MRKTIIAAALCALSTGALAQSGCPPIIYGAVLTAGQWQSCFQAKNDVLGFIPLNIAGGTLTGPLVTFPSTTLGAGFNIPPGVAPTSPNNGDIWETAAGGFVGRVNGNTVGMSFPVPVRNGDIAIWNSGTGVWATLAGNNSGNAFLQESAAGVASWQPAAGTGTVTSVGLALPGIFTVSGSPVTGAGTLTGTFNTQLANLTFAGPSSGGAAAPA